VYFHVFLVVQIEAQWQEVEQVVPESGFYI
jgi:hypothetical protein